MTAFRQQLHDWQAKVLEVKKSMNQSDSRVSDRHADLEAAEQRIETMRQELARRTEELHEEQRIANEKRNEMERHLADMREWYRHKLRDLAAGRTIDDSDMPDWEKAETRTADTILPMPSPPSTLRLPPSEADPADQQLGDLLRSRGLVDDAMLQSLWAEARRQRKSLRQTLLASGVVTVYQLALIEAGNLDGLVMGRFRVIDRLRAGQRETVYRVYDPSRPRVDAILRVLGDGDSRDGIHSAEFLNRFAAATHANHVNLANTLEVLEIAGRPAALQEAVSGLPSSDWPPLAATPGVWLRLLVDAAKGLAQAHSVGLVHGRLAPESFVLTADGTLKVVGLGEPGWLNGASAAIFDPLPASDLRALGRVAFAWSQIGAKRRVSKGKPFPAELAAVIRRLEAGAESPMGDIVALERPFADTAELVKELDALAVSHPCPPDAWTKLLRIVSEEDAEDEPLRQTA